MSEDEIPVGGFHRGIGLHAYQSASRLEIVKRDIDAALALADLDALVAWAADVLHAPESRLLAAAKAEATWQIAVDGREARPDFDLEYLRACVAGLGSRRRMSPWLYCSTLDTPAAPGERGAAKRETPLTDAERGRA